MPTRNRKILGDRGEAIAAAYLERAGWSILERNFRHGRKEIDLIARRGDVVAFVEVKARASGAFGHPLEAVTPRKRREIEEVAAAWIQARGGPDDFYRFDAVAVLTRPDGTARVDHVEDAWRL